MCWKGSTVNGKLSYHKGMARKGLPVLLNTNEWGLMIFSKTSYG